jgi:Flp pilus assembly protein TadG
VRTPATLLRRWRRDRRGATAVEFAFIGPLFILLVMCVIEFGIELMTQLELDNAVAAAARQVELGNAPQSSTFVSDVCSHASALLASCSASTLQVYVTAGSTFAGLTPAAVSSSGVLTPHTYNAGTSGQAVLVQVAYTRRYDIPWLSKAVGSSATLLSTFAVMQQPAPLS